MSRILADMGPLVALLDRRDADHDDCVAASQELRGTLVTTWPVVTEAFYLLAPDTQAQDSLMGKIESGDLEIASMGAMDVPSIRALLVKYGNLRMALPMPRSFVRAIENGSTRCSRWTMISRSIA